MNAVHISTLRKLLSSPEPLDLTLWTRSGEIQHWHRCISLRYDFYKNSANRRQNIKQLLNVLLRCRLFYQKACAE